jgi:hypothetical protein
MLHHMLGCGCGRKKLPCRETYLPWLHKTALRRMAINVAFSFTFCVWKQIHICLPDVEIGTHLPSHTAARQGCRIVLSPRPWQEDLASNPLSRSLSHPFVRQEWGSCWSSRSIGGFFSSMAVRGRNRSQPPCKTISMLWITQLSYQVTDTLQNMVSCSQDDILSQRARSFSQESVFYWDQVQINKRVG